MVQSLPSASLPPLSSLTFSFEGASFFLFLRGSGWSDVACVKYWISFFTFADLDFVYCILGICKHASDVFFFHWQLWKFCLEAEKMGFSCAWVFSCKLLIVGYGIWDALNPPRPVPSFWENQFCRPIQDLGRVRDRDDPFQIRLFSYLICSDPYFKKTQL